MLKICIKTGKERKSQQNEQVKNHREHPCRIFNFMRIWFHIAMVECASTVHVDFMIIFQVGHQKGYITSDWTFWSSIWTIERPIDALRFMFDLAIIWVYANTTIALIFTGKFKRCSHLLQCKTSYIAKFMPASRASIVHPRLATRTQCVAIWTLQKETKKEPKKKCSHISSVLTFVKQIKRDQNGKIDKNFKRSISLKLHLTPFFFWLCTGFSFLFG